MEKYSGVLTNKARVAHVLAREAFNHIIDRKPGGMIPRGVLLIL